MQKTTTIQKAIEEQNRQLHTAKVAIDRVQDELITHLTAVALGEPDNGRAAELRNYLLVHQQTLEETPQVLTKLFIQEAALQEQAAADDRLAARQENDRLFFDLLNRIIAAGTSPSPKAVEEEMNRLRKSGTAAPQPAAVQMAPSHGPAAVKPSAAPPTTSNTGLPQPAAKQQANGNAFLHGNAVTVNGQSYPLNPDGTVTISGRKFRVQ